MVRVRLKNSIKNLSPNDPTIKALSELSMDSGVPFHSIIGDQGTGDGEEVHEHGCAA